MISPASHRRCENIHLLLRNLSDDLAALPESWNKSHSLKSCLLDGISYKIPVYRGGSKRNGDISIDDIGNV